jgi:pimeloyl-ACP methyl ester carboxylesterase
MRTRRLGERQRRARGTRLAVLALFLATVLFLAYGYQPPEVRDEASHYLSQVQTHSLDTTAFRVHYLQAGHGEPIVLLPGGGTWLYELRSLIAVFAPNYTVYALDPPGSGYTTPRSERPRYDLPTIDQTLLEFMDRLGIARSTLVGHSFGGGYAVYFAEQHPERVSGLVLLASVGLDMPYAPLFEAMRWPVLGELSTKFITPELMRRQLEGLVADPAAITDELVRETYIPATFRSNRVALYQLTRQLDWRLTEAGLATLRMPVLLIWGRDDQLQPVARLERWRALLPHAEVLVVEGAGHLLQEDQPERVNEAVLAFLADKGT